MPDPLHILIVEDDVPAAIVMERLVRPLMEAFPSSMITASNHLAHALSVAKLITPDAIVLDLTLPDSTMEQTIARIEEFESRAPVVIVTGHNADRVKSLLATPVEVINKTTVGKPGVLVEMIVSVIKKWRTQRASTIEEERKQRIDANLLRMREIVTNGTPETTG